MNYNKIFNGIRREEPSLSEVEDVPEMSQPPKEPMIATVISHGKLNIRMGASRFSPILCTVNPGDELLVEDVSGDWAHIYTSVGLEGYAMKEFIFIKS